MFRLHRMVFYSILELSKRLHVCCLHCVYSFVMDSHPVINVHSAPAMHFDWCTQTNFPCIYSPVIRFFFLRNNYEKTVLMLIVRKFVEIFISFSYLNSNYTSKRRPLLDCKSVFCSVRCLFIFCVLCSSHMLRMLIRQCCIYLVFNAFMTDFSQFYPHNNDVLKNCV